MLKFFVVIIACFMVIPAMCFAGNAERITASPLSGRLSSQTVGLRLSQRMGTLELPSLAITYSRLKPLPKDVKKQRISKANHEFVQRKKVNLILSNTR